MYCQKCGLPTVNGERQCRECGADIEGRGGPAVMTVKRRVLPLAKRRSHLAELFMGFSAAGMICMMGAGGAVLVLRRLAGEVNVMTSGLALGGLCLLAVGFVLLCSALIFAVMGGLRLRQNPSMRGRWLMLAGTLFWLGGAIIFLLVRKDPHFRAPAPPLAAAAAQNQR